MPFFLADFVCAQAYPIEGRSIYGNHIRKASTLCIYRLESGWLKRLGRFILILKSMQDFKNLASKNG